MKCNNIPKGKIFILIAYIGLLTLLYMYLCNKDFLATNTFVFIAFIILIPISLATSLFILRQSYNKKKSSLTKKILKLFSLVTILPSLTTGAVVGYFFYFGFIEWFEDKIKVVFDEYIELSKLYIQEKENELKYSAMLLKAEIETKIDLKDDMQSIQKLIYDQALFRSVDDIVIFRFHEYEVDVLARARFSFTIPFMPISKQHIKLMHDGEVIILKDGPKKIVALMKLEKYNKHEHGNLYLAVSTSLNERIAHNIRNPNGPLAQYSTFHNTIDILTNKAVLGSALTITMVLCTTIGYALWFSRDLVNRIEALFLAARRVISGENTELIEISIDTRRDEITKVAEAFNTMLKQISYQKEVVISTQRSIAWADVAKKIAHEIKNPLTPMRLAVDMLSYSFREEISNVNKFNRYIDILHTHIEDINRILSEFIYSAKMPNLRPELIDVVSTLRLLIDSNKVIYKNIKYIFEYDTDYLEIVFDKTQFNQLVINILKNAAESINDSKADNNPMTIHVSLRRQQEEIILSIKDTGNGFKEEEINRVTEPYFTTKPHGLGLGLTVVKEIIRENQGMMRIFNNDRNMGAMIEVILKKPE